MSEKWSVEPGRQSEKHWSEVLADSVFQLAESVCEGLIDLATATREQTAEVVKFHQQDRDHADGLRSRHSADMALDREASGQVVEQYVSVFKEIAESIGGQVQAYRDIHYQAGEWWRQGFEQGEKVAREEIVERAEREAWCCDPSLPDTQKAGSEAQEAGSELSDKYISTSYQTGYERGWREAQGAGSKTSAEEDTSLFSEGWQRGYEMGYREGQDWEREKQGLPPVEPEEGETEEEEVVVPDTITGGQVLSYTFDTLDECLEKVLSCYAYSKGVVEKVEFEAERCDDGEWMMKVMLEYRRPATAEEKGEV